MNLLHIADLGNGPIQASWQWGNAIQRRYPHAISFTDPLSPKDRGELRWYLEGYLDFPYGAERYRAEQVERQMAEWGAALFTQVMAIRERLELERDAASHYHQLGNVAYLRQQFAQAEVWYSKALEIYERLGHPPLMVNTLAQLGVLRQRQSRLDEAVSWFGSALPIAAEYQMRVGAQILRDLARLMKALGEERFTLAWRQAFADQEPPLTVLREVLEQLNQSSRDWYSGGRSPVIASAAKQSRLWGAEMASSLHSSQ